MSRFGEIIASAAAVNTMYAERLLTGVKSEQFARLARPGGVTVQSNHPAFVFGHLSLYPVRVLEHLGQPAGAARVPEGWEARFKSGAECLDDPDARHYPSMTTLTSFYFAAYKAVAEAIRGASDEVFAAPNPATGRMKELFPQLGAMLTFYVCGHPQVHLGQLSAWRRMMGLAPV